MPVNSVSDDETKSELKWVYVKSKTNDVSGTEKLKKKILANPVVPIGALFTALVLSNGLYHFLKHNQRKQQIMMRYRVLGQAFTICAMLVGTLFIPKKDK